MKIFNSIHHSYSFGYHILNKLNMNMDMPFKIMLDNYSQEIYLSNTSCF